MEMFGGHGLLHNDLEICTFQNATVLLTRTVCKNQKK